MKIILEQTLEQFEAWSGAEQTRRDIIDAGKAEQFEDMIEEFYPYGITACELNDMLWFSRDEVLQSLDIEDEDGDDE